MPIEIKALDGVPEDALKKMINEFADVGANIVTAINDGKGTFSVEATFLGAGSQGSITQSGKMSTFGGPHDMGVSSGEGLALFDSSNAPPAPDGLFLDTPPPGTTGLARQLNPLFNYLAYRWDYGVTPPAFLRTASVTVSAKGKSITALPVDWGPNISTGRIADLSPGLAHALGLATDDACTLVIPVPAGVQIAVPEAPPELNIDLRTLDATVFPTDMARTLVVMTVCNDTVHWLLNVVGPNEAGQTLMKRIGDGKPVAIRSDTVLLPIEPGADIPQSVAGELNKAVRKEPAIVAGPAGPAPGAGDDVAAKMFDAARTFVGHTTSGVPGTDHGNLACAWAVNEVARLALGKPISGRGGKNGLSTAELFEALKARHTKLNTAGDARPGSIIIAPTVGVNHGHVGIVGATTGGVNATPVFSNKSRPGIFAQNYTIGSFTEHYASRNLEVAFFDLAPQAFGPGV